MAAAVWLVTTFATRAPALWRDEVTSVNTQSAPSIAEMWRRSEFDSFPPLWPLLLRTWMVVPAGRGDAGLRLLGVLGAASLVGAVWFAARRFGRRAPVLALALIALNPEILRWSAGVRAWGFGTALAIATMPLLFDACERPATSRLIVAALVAAGSVLCLYQNAIFLAAGVIGCVAVAARAGEWRRVVAPIGLGLVAAVALLPTIPLVLRRAEWNALGSGPVTVEAIAGQLAATVASAGIVASIAWMALAAVAVIVGLRALLPAAQDRDASPDAVRRREIAVFSAVTIVAATTGLLAFYLQLGYPTQSWYYVGLLSLVAVLAEAAIRAVWLSRFTGRVLALAAGVVLATSVAPAWIQLTGERQTNIDAIGARLNTEARRGDVVIVNPWFLGITLSRYYTGAAPVVSIPPLSDLTVARYDLLKAHMERPDAAMPLVIEALRQALSSGHRVWIVGDIAALPPGTPVPHLPAPPRPETGWNSMAYETQWGFEAGAFLQEHSRERSVVETGVTGGRFENPRLLLFQGWK